MTKILLTGLLNLNQSVNLSYNNTMSIIDLWLFCRPSSQNTNISSASGFIQNILKEGEISKLTEEEQCRICSILCTAEYCMETSQQLEEKLKEKVDKELASKIDLNAEQDLFHK